MAIYSDEKIELVERRSSAPRVMQYAHFHNKNELYYLEKGRVKYFVGNEIFILNDGDMIFVPKGVFHKTDSGESGKNFERLLFVFDDEFLPPESAVYIDELKKDKLIRFRKDVVYKIEDVLHRIESEARKKQKDYKLLQELYFRELLVLVSRYRIREEQPELNQSHMIMQDAAKYISDNYDADLTLTTLASRYAMSPGHFSKQFKNITGVGLCEYINICRISAAEKLLAKNNLPVTMVATMCGFNDSNYFAAVFKKLKGVTPKRYAMMNKHTGLY